MADSLESYIRQAMGWSMTDDHAKQVLEDALNHGGLSTSAYETAWSDYKTCMIDRGYRPFELTRYPNGIYVMPPHTVGTDAQEQQYTEDYQAYYLPIMPIETVYRMQRANPSLLRNQNEAVVDCLKRDGVVPMSYTTSDYAAGRLEQTSEFFDFKDPPVRGYQVANGVYSTYPADAVAQLW